MKHASYVGKRKICYVYRAKRERYAVGFYAPSGTWHEESEILTRELAAQRVAWLNGSKNERAPH